MIFRESGVRDRKNLLIFSKVVNDQLILGIHHRNNQKRYSPNLWSFKLAVTGKIRVLSMSFIVIRNFIVLQSIRCVIFRQKLQLQSLGPRLGKPDRQMKQSQRFPLCVRKHSKSSSLNVEKKLRATPIDLTVFFSMIRLYLFVQMILVF